LFAPLNDIGVIEWSETYGLHNLEHTAWFFILIILLTFLGVNTFICTTDRMLVLTRARKNMEPLRFMFSLAPHVMHYAVLIILSGYLCSYLFSTVIPMKSLIPGMPVPIGNSGLTVTMQKLELDYYTGRRMPLFYNYALGVQARLLIADGAHQRQATLGINDPVWSGAYGIFLKDYSPRKKDGGMKRASDRVDVSIRKDYGVYFYMAGMLFFFVGLLFYVYGMVYFKLLKKGTS